MLFLTSSSCFSLNQAVSQFAKLFIGNLASAKLFHTQPSCFLHSKAGSHLTQPNLFSPLLRCFHPKIFPYLKINFLSPRQAVSHVTKLFFYIAKLLLTSPSQTFFHHTRSFSPKNLFPPKAFYHLAKLFLTSPNCFTNCTATVFPYSPSTSHSQAHHQAVPTSQSDSHPAKLFLTPSSCFSPRQAISHPVQQFLSPQSCLSNRKSVSHPAKLFLTPPPSPQLFLTSPRCFSHHKAVSQIVQPQYLPILQARYIIKHITKLFRHLKLFLTPPIYFSPCQAVSHPAKLFLTPQSCCSPSQAVSHSQSCFSPRQAVSHLANSGGQNDDF